MGWEEIPWYTVTDEFDADFDVDEWHGTNVFFREDDDRVFRTYSSTAAGTRRWGARGATSTSPRSGARRIGRTRRRATPDPGERWWRHDEYDAPAGSQAAKAMAVQVERGRAAGQTKSSG